MTNRTLLVALAGSLLGCVPIAAQQSATATLSAFQQARAEALLERKLPCLGCHTMGSRGGLIGPDLSNVGARLDRARIRAQIENPRATFANGIMPRIALPASTLDLLVNYLAAQHTQPVSQPAARSQPAVSSGSEGAALYGKHCAACHGAGGAGDGFNAARLDRPPARHADARAMSMRTDDRLYDAIAAGGAIMGGSARMPPYRETLTPAQIRLLVAHIRELCRCRQPAWADGTR